MNKTHYKPGNYIGEVLEQGLSKSSKGNPQFILRVKVLGTPLENDEYEEDKMQYSRTIYYTLTDATIGFVAEALEILGYQGDGIGPLDPAHPKHQSFVGQQVNLYCKHEDNDKLDTVERWSINNGSGATLKLIPLDAKEIKRWDALFGKALKKKGVGTSTSTARTVAPKETQQKAVVPYGKAQTIKKTDRIPNDDEQYFADDGTEITNEDIPF